MYVSSVLKRSIPTLYFFALLIVPGCVGGVGQMSADFHRHPVGNLMQGVLALHDRSEFEVVCLSLLVSEQRQRIVVRYAVAITRVGACQQKRHFLNDVCYARVLELYAYQHR
jgi:hypothetical protein